MRYDVVYAWKAGAPHKAESAARLPVAASKESWER
jgi:hypothetical protein